MIEKNLNPTAQPLDVDNTTLLQNSLDGSFNKPLNRQPNTDSELKGDTGGNTNPPDSEDMDDLGWKLNDNNDGFGVDDVNRDNDSSLSTDLRDKFGDYGSIFSDILSQLESLFNDGRDLVEHVNGGTNGSSVFSSFLHAISAIADRTSGAETANLTNAVTQMMSFYMQMISAQMQNQFNVQQWQIQNEYNSPAEQLKRLSDAGLNPLHYFDSSSTNSSTTVQASSGFSANGGIAQSDPSKFQKAMGYLSSGLGVAGQLAGVVTGGIGLQQAAQGLSQGAQKVANETAKTNSEIKKIQAETAKINQDAQLGAQSYVFNEQMNSKHLESMYHTIQLQKAQYNVMSQEERNKSQEYKNLQAEEAALWQSISLESGRFLRENKLADKTIAEMDSRIAKNYGELDKLFSEAQSIRTKSDYDKWTYNFAKKTGVPLGTPLMDGFMLSAANGQLKVQEFKNITNFLRKTAAAKGDISVTSVPMTAAEIGSEYLDDGLRWLDYKNQWALDQFAKFKESWFQMDNSFKNLKPILTGGVPSQNDIYYGTSRP